MNIGGFAVELGSERNVTVEERDDPIYLMIYTEFSRICASAQIRENS